jgi:hypothetical protein
LGLDLNRITATALVAALDDGKEPKRRSHPGLRAVAVGAALVGAARVVVGISRAPDLRTLQEALDGGAGDGDSGGAQPASEAGSDDPGDESS